MSDNADEPEITFAEPPRIVEDRANILARMYEDVRRFTMIPPASPIPIHVQREWTVQANTYDPFRALQEFIVTETLMPSTDDDIVLIDEPIPTTVDGVEFTPDVTMTALPVVRKRKAPAIVEVKAPPKKDEPVLHQGLEVYVKDHTLYTSADPNLAYSTYTYVDRYSLHPKVKAAAMMHGTTPVFAPTEAALNMFKTLLGRVDITVAQDKTLCFFNGTEFRVSNDTLVAIAFDGNVVRYGGTNTNERILALDNPIVQSPDFIFRQISGFAMSSVKEIKRALDMAKATLSDIKAKRHEDIYLYLNDINPTSGNEDLHTLLVDRARNSYEADARAAAQQLAIVTEKQRGVDNAKSQLPSGRKGVPLRNGYLTAPAIKNLLEYFKIVRDRDTMRVIFAFRKDLIVEGIRYGRPEVTINMTTRPGYARGGFIADSGGCKVRSADFKAFMHPHIEGETRWCLGTYIEPISAAIMGGNIPVAASLIWRYLSEYNSASPLIDIRTCKAQMESAQPRDLIIRRK